MPRRSAVRIVAVILGLCGLSGCVASKPTAEATDVPATAPPPATAESTTPIFPHPSGWKNAASHGAAAHVHGTDACQQCHATTDPWSTAPACRTCHAEYPHRPEWVQPTQHGAFVREQGKAQCATQCHGTDLAGGLSGVSCTTCHTLYPHAATWRDPAQHGQLAKWGGRTACQGCHGEDLAGGSSGVACTQCHAQYPHPSGWREREQHGAWVKGHTSADCATGCHGSDLNGGRTGVSCTGCHQTYPHQPGWATREQHGATARTLGTAECARCHGKDFKTVLGGKTCATCHADYPHPANAVWRPFNGGHGARVQQDYGGATNECRRCHGETLERELNGKTCFSCHPSYPHRGTEATSWKSYGGHGAYALAASTGECALCHGATLHGELRGNPSCSSSDTGCHAAYPHGTAWALPKGLPQEHAKYVQSNGLESCGTAHCHGVNLQVEPKVTVGPSCNGCHETFPHPAGWASGLLHGPSALADIDNCKACHGPKLELSLGGKSSCVECHSSYVAHDSAAVGAKGWSLLSGHGAYLLAIEAKPERYAKIAECRTCHGPKNNSIGVPKKTCGYATCHASYPHEDPQWGTVGAAGEPPQHIGYIKETLQGNLDTCRVCHGAALDGGHAKQSCMSCHPGYPHAAGWAAAEGTPQPHAQQVADAGIASCATAQCHGVNLHIEAGVSGGPSCSKCHENLPHPDGWGAGAIHGAAAVKDIAGCKVCHGAQLDVPLGGKPACVGCHADYPHAPGWARPWNTKATTLSGHGPAFTKQATAMGPKDSAKPVSCWICHDKPVQFNEKTDTKATLAAKGDCYTCHWTYPHWQITEAWLVREWEPAVTYSTDANGQPCGSAQLGEGTMGHFVAMIDSKLMTDSTGKLYTFSWDPKVDSTPYVAYTCGGGATGGCHAVGYRSVKHGGADTCSQYCHNANLPAATVYPACPAPPAPPPPEGGGDGGNDEEE